MYHLYLFLSVYLDILNVSFKLDLNDLNNLQIH